MTKLVRLFRDNGDVQESKVWLATQLEKQDVQAVFTVVVTGSGEDATVGYESFGQWNLAHLAYAGTILLRDADNGTFIPNDD